MHPPLRDSESTLMMLGGFMVHSDSSPQAIRRSFAGYVSQNILGMIGISAYVLADTFFISLAEGADGITALNLVLPLYSLIFAIGSMIAVGSATRFAISRARGDSDSDSYLFNALFFALVLGLLFTAAGILIPDRLIALLGGDPEIVRIGTPYTRLFLLFGPIFMWNYILNAFVRNDKNPSLAMAATLSSSMFNIVMDYVLMFPLDMGMSGAALATAISPLVGILVCSLHFLSRKNTLRLRAARPSVRKLLRSCQLGVPAFVGEISSGVTTTIFNFLILGLAGNVGVAAYGVVANNAMVATSIFNGIAQGSQPLLSRFHGRREHHALRQVLRLSLITTLCAALLVVLITNIATEPIVAMFNGEGNPEMAAYADTGVRLYFTGYLFAGFNIVGTGFLSATEAANWAFAASILRGFIAISVCAFVMAALFGMTGIWLAFPAAELITACMTALGIRRTVSRN